MLRIPRSFNLMGLTINIGFDRTLFATRKIVGEARYTSQNIVIDPSIQMAPSVEHNFYHEKVHWILYVMGEDDLRTNEKFVDMFAYLLHQSDVTSQNFYAVADLRGAPRCDQP